MYWTKLFVPAVAAMALWGSATAASAQNNALHFDGVGDRVQMAVPSVFANAATQDFSVSVWLRPESTIGRVFYAQQSQTNLVTLLVSGQSILLYVRKGSFVTYTALASAPPLDTWSHVTVTWVAATEKITMFFDGEEVPTTSGGATSLGVDGIMTIGSRTDGLQNLQGSLDDFKIWSVALSPEQVRAEALSTCGASAPLVAFHDFDIGTPGGANAGLTGLPDVSGMGLHGTLLDFALDGPTSNWIASSVTQTAPALVFDPPLPDVLITGEDGSGYTGTVALAAPPVSDVLVEFAVDDVSEGAVSAASLTFTPADWNVPQPVSILGVDDDAFDGAVDYGVSIAAQSSDACYAGLGFTLAASNVDNESASITASDVTQAEGDEKQSTFVFELTLDAAVPGGVSVPFQTVDGTAVAGSDYAAASGAVQFTGEAGEVQQVSVTVFGDHVAQGDRAFALLLGPAAPVQVAVVPAQVQGIIVDDDPATIAASGVVQAEGDETQSTFVFELTLDAAVPGGVSVPFQTADGTASAGTDYVAASGTVQFAGVAGEVQQVEVTVLGNRVAQGDRTFSLQLGPASSALVSVAPSQLQGVIVDDDLDVSVTLSNGVDAVLPGQALTYVLVATNHSPTLDAGEVNIAFAPSPLLDDLHWTCSAFGGAVCATSGVGVIDTSVALPPGSMVIFAIAGTVPATHHGDVVASASATLGEDVDSQPQNNHAVDVDLGPVLFADGFE